MVRLSVILLAPLVVVAITPAMADDVAAERARLANQRIQIEEERRAREEAERLELAQTQTQTEPEDRRKTTMETAAASDQPRDRSSAQLSHDNQRERCAR
jgi:hypothetical protein